MDQLEQNLLYHYFDVYQMAESMRVMNDSYEESDLSPREKEERGLEPPVDFKWPGDELSPAFGRVVDARDDFYSGDEEAIFNELKREVVAEFKEHVEKESESGGSDANWMPSFKEAPVRDAKPMAPPPKDAGNYSMKELKAGLPDGVGVGASGYRDRYK